LNDTPASLFHHFFDRWVQETPDAIAVEGDHGSLSYGQLDELASKVAWSLNQLGVKPGDVVAMHMPRSISIWAAILGIFRVGGIFLPLDVDWPTDRMSYALAKSGSRYLLLWEGSALAPISPEGVVMFYAEPAG
jgi:non-ribosomal peptide synthetase component F